jgi:DNA helicase-2/ATP-dependent DNA helicase PcrA
VTHELSAQQLAAIGDAADVLQLVACAGAGKTEVLARRVVRELERSEPAGVVAFTFTNRAAAELRERIERRSREAGVWTRPLPPTTHGLFVGTIHAFCLDRIRTLSGQHEAFDILSEERQWSLAVRYARRLGIVDLYAEHQARDPTTAAAAPAVEIFLDNLDFVHNQGISRDRLRATAPRLADVVTRYELLLERMQLLSFGSVIERVCSLLEPGQPLHRELTGRIKHVFVDEYQDLNPAQEDLLRRLRGLGARITVVGDDDQAIYQWRGGDVDLFVRFVERHPGAKRLKLDRNYRSRAALVRSAALVADTIPGRTPKQMVPCRSDDGPALEYFSADGPEQEAAQIVLRIQHLLEAGHRPGDIAILCRSLRTSADPFRRQLERVGIAVRSSGPLSLLSCPETAIITRLFVLWTGGVWYPEHQAEMVTASRLADDLAALLQLSKTEAAERAQSVVALGERTAASDHVDLISVLDEVFSELGLPGTGQGVEEREHGLGQLSRLVAEFEHAQRRAGPTARDLDEAATPSADATEEDSEDARLTPTEDAADVAPQGPQNLRLGVTQGEVILRRLKSFLEAFGRQAVEQYPVEGERDADAVHLMTIHGSKGLEFPVVFIPALVKGRFPSSLTGRAKHWLLPDAILGDARQRYEGRIEDELRLLYVALTRAKQLAVISTFGEGRASPFIDSLKPAIVAHLVERLDRASAEPLSGPRPEETLQTDFSALAVYDECSFKYRLRYLCGFAPRIAPELGFGKLLHHLVAEVARAARAGTAPSAALVDSLLERDFYLPFAGRMTKAQLRAEARKRVVGFIDRNAGLLARMLEPEFPFEVPLAGAHIAGRVDLLARADSGAPDDVVLVDFKTTEDRPPPPTHENQLRLYAEACRALGRNPVALEIHDLRPQGRVHVVKDDPGRRDAFRRELEGWVRGIRSGRFEPCEGRKACTRCDFRSFCRWAPRAQTRAGG